MDAIVLAGGAGSRLGGPHKPDQLVGIASLLQRVVDAVPTAVTIAVVGPQRPGVSGVRWCIEQPRGGGPVAAIAAGLAETADDPVLVLAADLPWIAGAIAPLLAAVRNAECAVLVDASGRRNPLAAAWRRPALERALGAIAEHCGARARALLEAVDVVEVLDEGGWGEDCDTPDDLARARSRAGATNWRTP